MSNSIHPKATAISEDRHFIIPQGCYVKTEYVHVKEIQMGIYNRMSMEAVEKAYRKHLQLGSSSSFPPPMGKWEGDKFIVIDGRHEVLGAQIAGKSVILVAWIECELE